MVVAITFKLKKIVFDIDFFSLKFFRTFDIFRAFSKIFRISKFILLFRNVTFSFVSNPTNIQFSNSEKRFCIKHKGVMLLLCEHKLEFDEKLFVSFVDFEKTFDRVKRTKLLKVLKKIGEDSQMKLLRRVHLKVLKLN